MSSAMAVTIGERKELLDWIKTFHYKPGLADVTYEVANALDLWTIVFDTKDNVFVYGYPNGKFTLRFHDSATFDVPDNHLMNYDSLAHRIKGVVFDEFWYGLTK